MKIEVKRCTYSNQYLFVFHFTVNLFYCSVVACITIFPSHQVRRVMQARVTGLDPITQFSGLCKRIFPGNPCLHFSRPHSLILMHASLMQASLCKPAYASQPLCKPALYIVCIHISFVSFFCFSYLSFLYFPSCPCSLCSSLLSMAESSPPDGTYAAALTQASSSVAALYSQSNANDVTALHNHIVIDGFSDSSSEDDSPLEPLSSDDSDERPFVRHAAARQAAGLPCVDPVPCSQHWRYRRESCDKCFRRRRLRVLHSLLVPLK